MKSAISLATIGLLFGSPLWAGTVDVGRDDLCQTRFSGQILKGDADTLRKVFDENGALEGGIHGQKLCLDSPGGSITEGLRIGQLLYDRGIPTRLEAEAECLSSCAIAFMMGNTYGDHAPGDGHNADRRMHTSSVLGFHRPELVSSVADRNDSALLGEAFDLAIEASLQFIVLANFGSYRETMIPSDLIQSMYAHRGSDFFYIDTIGKAGRWNIGIDGVRWPDAIDKRSAIHACDNLGEWQSRYSEVLMNEIDADRHVDILTRNNNEIVFAVLGNFLTESSGNECLVRVTGEEAPILEVCGSFPSDERFVGNGDCRSIAAADPNIERWASPLQSIAPRFEMNVIFEPSTPLSSVQNAAREVQRKGRALAKVVSSPVKSLRRRCNNLGMSARVRGVSSFTNLRSQPGLEAAAIGQVELGGIVKPINGQVHLWNTQAGERCETLCEYSAFGLTSLISEQYDFEEISQCYDANRFWYEVETENGQVGFVSGKFLQY
ncbi:hypothetical protein EBB79_03130 [Parasedimentitalea marina]|uniref:SH3 domain-containing protein n=1 Tax=Parasedimentitalea marina TaxID=2483033 RepID=A0A3T0MZ05_9RHOB|nr:hypothetical protein [Parasedimentitalea marina]AZV76987.1 hypothetical protein EBB79_03130 [Parasedimentitalea marina]